MHQKQTIPLATLLVIMAAFAAAVHDVAAIEYQGLQTEKYLGDVEVVATIEGEKVFTEGPAFGADGNLYFTNIPVSKILKYDPASGALSVFREDTQETNGLMFDPQGRLLMCQGGAGQLARLNLNTGKVEVLAATYNGFPLAAPNDLCYDSRGRIYFTSRPGTKDPKKGNVNAVYRLDPDGKLTHVRAWPAVHMGNGIVASPERQTLYLI